MERGISVTTNKNNRLLRGSSTIAWAVPLLTAPIMAVLAAPALAGDPPPAESWRDDYVNESYFDWEVSIGYHGARVLSDTGWTALKTRLYSNTSVSSPNVPDPIWERSSGASSWDRALASADEADVHAVLRREQASGSSSKVARLEVFGSSDSVAQVNWVFPDNNGGSGANFCDVSADGRWVASAIRVGLTAHVVVFDLNTSTQVPVLDTYYSTDPIGYLSISDDGSRLYISSQQGGHILRVSGGPNFHSETFFNTQNAGHSFSDDGSTFARPTDGGVKVSREEAGSYVLVREHAPYAWGAPQHSGLTALNEDGSVLAAAFYTVPDFQDIEIFVWDVQTGIELLHDTIYGSGSFDNKPSALEFSDDGDRLALGAWGDEHGQAPEVTVYERQYDAAGTALGYQHFTQFHLPGSVGGLDLSGNGDYLACTGRNSHFNWFSGTKFVAVFDLGADLRVSGQASPGQYVNFEYFPQSTNSVFLLMASQPAATATTFGEVGTLYLNRGSGSNFTLRSMSGVDAHGMASLNFQIPSSLTAGQTLYFQGYSSTPRRLSDNWIPLTVQ
jgi:hypothetical protein